MVDSGMCRLPEECVSHVLSLTTPCDSCRSAAVSPAMRSAADSDAVWERFLPPDFRGLLSRAVAPVEFSTRKDLYFRLCTEPLLIDGGRKSFVLDKSTGKKCFMLSARELAITWGDTPQYWKWVPVPGSRFSEAAELSSVCWLEISGKMETAWLSPKTTYVAYFIYKLASGSHGLGYPNQETYVSLGAQTSQETLCLQPEELRMSRTRRRRFIHFQDLMYQQHPMAAPEIETTKRVPHTRDDGWMEIIMGEFFNDDGGDGEVYMRLLETKGGHWKSGLIVQGIELRPKK